MEQVTSTSRQASSEVSVPRRFSATYKLKVLADIDAAAEKGQIGQIQGFARVIAPGGLVLELDLRVA
jgi:hypothetical protein